MLSSAVLRLQASFASLQRAFRSLRRQPNVLYYYFIYVCFGVHLLGGLVRAIHTRPLLPAPVAPSIPQLKKHWLPYQCFLLFNSLSFILCFPCPKGLSALAFLLCSLPATAVPTSSLCLFLRVKPLSHPPPTGAPPRYFFY